MRTSTFAATTKSSFVSTQHHRGRPRTPISTKTRASFLGDMFKGVMSPTNGKPPASSSAFLDVTAAPSWDELQEMAAAMSVELGVPLPKDEDLVNGPPNPLSLRRMFGTTDEPRVKLYRDHAAWCPYCHKVVLQLEEKRIPYVIEKINMRCYGAWG